MHAQCLAGDRARANCQRGITKAAAKFTQRTSNLHLRCENRKIKDKVGACPDARTSARIHKEATKLTNFIAKACAGKDRLCGEGTGDNCDLPLIDIGWQISTCPNLEKGTCTNAINHCGDIAACVTCISQAAVGEVLDLYYAALHDIDPKTRDKRLKTILKCQQAIGKEGVRFLEARSKVLQKCWDKVSKGKLAGECPADDAQARAALARANTKMITGICRKCGGKDKRCDGAVANVFGTLLTSAEIAGTGGNDDLDPQVDIGFASTCPAKIVPGNGTHCGGDGSVDTLAELVECVSCVTEFAVACADRAAVPAFAEYPGECNAELSATLTPTPTPAATPAISLSFFHAEGRALVADGSGEHVVFRGVNLDGLEYGSFFAHPYPGIEGTNYFTPSVETCEQISLESWVNVVRVPFEWARLVSGWTPGMPLPAGLDGSYLAHLADVVGCAADQGIYVILEMHDFLKYWSAQSDQVCVDEEPEYQALLVHTWKLLAQHFAPDPAVLGYDLMNEPERQDDDHPCGSCNWHTIAQAVIDGIREVDAQHLIFVEGPNFSLASDWPVENGPTAFVVDRVTPPRLVYSPHVYFDLDNDSQYTSEGEENGPHGGWQYYVRDRLIAAMDWGVTNNVPLLFGELNVPCTAAWADVLDHVFTHFLAPRRLSATLWHYIDPTHCPLTVCPLNLAACTDGHQLDVMEGHPGGPYEDEEVAIPTPEDSVIYRDERVNPWDAGSGAFDELELEACATDMPFEGTCALCVRLDESNFAGVKFIHHFGIDTERFQTLRFRLRPDGAVPNFKLFTTRPRSDCDPQPDAVYPPTFDQQPFLSDFLKDPVPPGQWHQVEVPLAQIVDPANGIMNGLAFQNLGAPQERFCLDAIALVP